MGVPLRSRSRTSNPSSEAKRELAGPYELAAAQALQLHQCFTSPVMEGFSPPGANITESDWLSASMPAGFRPAEIEASEKCSEQKEYGCRNTENSDNDCLDSATEVH
jgi:hypothetical protein